MKLRDITNSECDVRKYMSIEIPDEVRYELENWDYDVDDVLGQARIYIDGHKLDDEIIPFNVEKHLELNSDQQVVLEWLKEEKTNSNLTAFDCIYSFIYGNPKDIVTQIWSELNEKEEGQVLEAFGKWAQEQEED